MNNEYERLNQEIRELNEEVNTLKCKTNVLWGICIILTSLLTVIFMHVFILK